MGDAATTVSAFLREHGYRLTHQRRAIIEAVLAGGEHFNAEELSGRLRRKGISRATVYRTLALLVECGVIRRAYRQDGKERYELGYGVMHHDHLVCTECGKVIEFRDERIEEIQQAVCRRRHFSVRDHRLIVRGICEDCARKRKDTARVDREATAWR